MPAFKSFSSTAGFRCPTNNKNSDVVTTNQRNAYLLMAHLQEICMGFFLVLLGYRQLKNRMEHTTAVEASLEKKLKVLAVF